MTNESPDKSQINPTTTRMNLNRAIAGMLSFATNPFGYRSGHEQVVDSLTKPITLGHSGDGKTNILEACTNGGGEIRKNIFPRFQNDCVRRTEDLGRRLVDSFAKFISSSRRKVDDVLKKGGEK
jgi:hypothetical protein